jgi:predicted double-glycine peptidase
MSGFAKAAVAIALCAGLAAAGLARAQTARGELIEGIDIERHGNEALITIRFNAPIAYSRHSPESFGKSLRIYPGLTGGAESASKGSLRLPDTDMVPLFTVSYPEPDDAILIEFDRETRFDVHPNSRSIAVSVPVLAGAQDWVVITRDWALKPVDPAAVRAALAASAVTVAEEPAAEPEDAVQSEPAQPVAAMPSEVQLVGFAGGGNGAFTVRTDSMKQVRFSTIVQQKQDWSCGSAAVATLLSYHYNHPMSEAEALDAMYERGNQVKIRREGFSLLDIKNFLESLGYQANGFETSLDRLARVKVPAIVIINDNGYNHFVVVKGLRHGNVLLGDPAKGNRVISRARFEAMWEKRIVFVITSRREGVAFNFSEDWRFMAAPLGDALGRDSLASALLVRAGPNDF